MGHVPVDDDVGNAAGEGSDIDMLKGASPGGQRERRLGCRHGICFGSVTAPEKVLEEGRWTSLEDENHRWGQSRPVGRHGQLIR